MITCGRAAFYVFDYPQPTAQQATGNIQAQAILAALQRLKDLEQCLLDGGWNPKQQQLEDERHLYYVGMIRAEETLTLCEFSSTNAFTQSFGEALLRQSFSDQHDPALDTQYQVFSMKDIDIGYPGRQPATALIHHAPKLCKL